MTNKEIQLFRDKMARIYSGKLTDAEQKFSAEVNATYTEYLKSHNGKDPIFNT
jgi:hypothetical protein